MSTIKKRSKQTKNEEQVEKQRERSYLHNTQ